MKIIQNRMQRIPLTFYHWIQKKPKYLQKIFIDFASFIGNKNLFNNAYNLHRAIYVNLYNNGK